MEQKKQLVYNSLHKPTKVLRTDMGKSLTIPDETLTMRQLLENHTRGIASAVAKTPIYEEEDSNPHGINPRVLDLVDIQGLQMDNKENIKKLDAKANAEAKEAKEAAAAAKKAQEDAWKAEILKAAQTPNP